METTTRLTVQQEQMIRTRKGAEIATKQRITKRGPVWVVPSQTHGGSYVVENDGLNFSCTCPDHELRKQPCKHVLAVEIVRTHSMPDGTVVQETLRVTYSQDWSSYNLAKTHDKERTELLLRDLCKLIVEPAQHMGRKRVALREAIPMAAMKVYSCKSGRDNDTDTRRLAANGVVEKPSYWTTVLRTIADPSLTPLFKALVEESASPLVAIESDFATDSSGFGCATYHRWMDKKHKKERKEHSWVKAHLTCGVRTHVITAAVVKAQHSADSPEMAGLLDTTAKRFTAREHSADMAYSGHANLAKILSLGAQPLIPFKDGTGEGVGSPLFWRKAHHYFHYNREEFLRKYHKRSNVETVFHMIKSRFGERVLAKSFAGQVNEVYLKALLHNTSVLVSCIYELGLEPVFAGEIAVGG